MEKEIKKYPSFESLIDEIKDKANPTLDVKDAANSLYNYLQKKSDSGAPKETLGKEIIEGRAFGSEIERKIVGNILKPYYESSNIDYTNVIDDVIDYLQYILNN